MPNRLLPVVMALLPGAIAGARRDGRGRAIVVASTTSTRIPGCSAICLPIFKAKTGIEVKVIAQGTGQALDTARRGDADVVFVHAKAQEEKFLAEGFGVKRFDVMYNDFVLIGPNGDPAGVKGKDTADRAQTNEPRAGAVRLARRPVGHARGGTRAVETGRHRHHRPQRSLVSRDRAGHGAGAQHGGRDERLRPVRPRHLDIVQEPRRSSNRRRGRQAAVQSIRRHAGEPGKISVREEGTRPDLRRLADLAGKARP